MGKADRPLHDYTMPTKPLKNNRPDRKDIRESILKSAQNIAAQDGWEAVSVRKIADSIGYTAPIIYEYFDGKEQLLLAILEHSHTLLYKALTTAASACTDQRERLQAIAVAYRDFSVERPELYRLLNGMGMARNSAILLHDYSRPTAEFLNSELIRFNPKKITSENAETFMVEAWSMLHGFISLSMAGYMNRHADKDEVFAVLLRDMLDSLARP